MNKPNKNKHDHRGEGEMKVKWERGQLCGDGQTINI